MTPPGNRSSALSARSMPGVRSLAAASTTRAPRRRGSAAGGAGSSRGPSARRRRGRAGSGCRRRQQRDAEPGLDAAQASPARRRPTISEPLGERVVPVVERLHHDQVRVPGGDRSATCSASSALEVKGFSHRTCLPASIALIVHGRAGRSAAGCRRRRSRDRRGARRRSRGPWGCRARGRTPRPGRGRGRRPRRPRSRRPCGPARTMAFGAMRAAPRMPMRTVIAATYRRRRARAAGVAGADGLSGS